MRDRVGSGARQTEDAEERGARGTRATPERSEGEGDFRGIVKFGQRETCRVITLVSRIEIPAGSTECRLACARGGTAPHSARWAGVLTPSKKEAGVIERNNPHPPEGE